jgi:hypothetical protein
MVIRGKLWRRWANSKASVIPIPWITLHRAKGTVFRVRSRHQLHGEFTESLTDFGFFPNLGTTANAGFNYKW